VTENATPITAERVHLSIETIGFLRQPPCNWNATFLDEIQVRY
jgi:hypothetical protein